MSGKLNTGESKFIAERSKVFGEQMSYCFTGKIKAQTSCARRKIQNSKIENAGLARRHHFYSSPGKFTESFVCYPKWYYIWKKCRNYANTQTCGKIDFR